jgi:ribosomal protein L37AE/L43A
MKKFNGIDGYTDYGFINFMKEYPEKLQQCIKSKHICRYIDNSLFQNRGTDNIYICDKCKIIYHVDCSD